MMAAMRKNGKPVYLASQRPEMTLTKEWLRYIAALEDYIDYLEARNDQLEEFIAKRCPIPEQEEKHDSDMA